MARIVYKNIQENVIKLFCINKIEITQISVDQSGAFDVKDVLTAIKPNTILISIMLANNETGVIQPVGELMREIKKLNLTESERICPLFVHSDAAQAIGKIKVDVDELQVDYLTIVGHKFYGPRIGALYARNCLNHHGSGEHLDDSTGKSSPIYHNYFGANQENGLRPGYKLKSEI